MASVPEALNAIAKPVPTMSEQKEFEKLHAQDQREIKALAMASTRRKALSGFLGITCRPNRHEISRLRPAHYDFLCTCTAISSCSIRYSGALSD
jgi:hypothetical protein